MDEDIVDAHDNLSASEKIFAKKLKLGEKWLDRIENGPLVNDDGIMKFKKNGDHGINDKIGIIKEKEETKKTEKPSSDNEKKTR